MPFGHEISRGEVFTTCTFAVRSRAPQKANLHEALRRLALQTGGFRVGEGLRLKISVSLGTTRRPFAVEAQRAMPGEVCGVSKHLA